MKPGFFALAALALTSQILAPCQQALAAVTVNQQLAQAATQMNRAGTLAKALEAMKQHPIHAGLTTELATTLRDKKVDTNAHLPTYIAKGNQLVIAGYGQPITFVSFTPFSVKIGADTWTAGRGENLAQIFDSLQAFLARHSSKGMGKLMDLLIPEARAGEFELLIGGLLAFWAIGTILNSTHKEDRGGTVIQGKERDRIIKEFKAQKLALGAENRLFLEELLCSGVKFSPKARELMAKHGPPRLASSMGLSNYREYREAVDGHAHVPGESLLALVWDFGEGHTETVEFSIRRPTVTQAGKQRVEKSAEGPIKISAKVREGKPVFLFPWGEGDDQARYQSGVFAEAVKKDGQPLGNTYSQNITPMQFEEELVPWAMEKAADAPLPRNKITTQEFLASTHTELVEKACRGAGEKILARNGVVPKYQGPVETKDTPDESDSTGGETRAD